ncbi:response regulator receiver protein [Candidatus Koribacter versatilis Ellin345]|uniref:Response regulator receiver protein n=1 Tax=Koribacter versatilis (strain Ellin345) TaxID=204669 RepID=Q1INZ7_KORVE|nr:response regulator [Candidatus Koribacter versatilis]ABF41403.1 response regulator receiver protein [Candidatus Koribacter versatilis Ellin345]
MTDSKPHILVVDDEPNVLVTYRLILQQQGYTVSAAISSEEARTVLKKGNVDLLLCDLSLEKQQSGFDVIQFGRDLDPDLSAVLLTGYASVEANERAEAEHIPVLFKPIDIQQLLQVIVELLRKNHESSEAHGG